MPAWISNCLLSFAHRAARRGSPVVAVLLLGFASGVCSAPHDDPASEVKYTLDGETISTAKIVNKLSGQNHARVIGQHELVNTGSVDSIFKIAVLADKAHVWHIEMFNGNDWVVMQFGSIFTDGSKAYAYPTVLAGKKYIFRALYNVPSVDEAPQAFPTITVTAIDPLTRAASTRSVTVLDEINVLPDAAAFTLTPTIDGTTTKAPGGGTWPASPRQGPRSRRDDCPATWTTGLLSGVKGCAYAVYTLTIRNEGNLGGRFVMSDTLPDGFTYVAGSAAWGMFGDALNDGPGGDPPGIDFQASGSTLNAVVTTVNSKETQYLSFMVRVNRTASIGTASTTNFTRFNAASAPDTITAAHMGSLDRVSGPASYDVKVYGVALGNASATAETAIDPTADVPGETDRTTLPSFDAEGVAKFSFTVFNTGDEPTDVTMEGMPGDTFPQGTTFVFYDAGDRPLVSVAGFQFRYRLGSPLGAGQSRTVVMRARLPHIIMGARTETPPYDVTLKARALSDATVSDVTLARVANLVERLMTFTKQQAPDPDCKGNPAADAYTTQTLPLKPGACVVYHVKAVNETGASISNVSISDSIPAQMSMTGAPQPEQPCVAPPDPDAAGPARMALSLADGKATCGTLARLLPDGIFTMTFGVRINDK